MFCSVVIAEALAEGVKKIPQMHICFPGGVLDRAADGNVIIWCILLGQSLSAWRLRSLASLVSYYGVADVSS